MVQKQKIYRKLNKLYVKISFIRQYANGSIYSVHGRHCVNGSTYSMHGRQCVNGSIYSVHGR